MTYHIPTERIDALALAATEGRVIRNGWHDTTEDGHEMACTLGWLGDDIEDPSECPAEYMPQWLAHLVPMCNDCTSRNGFTAWIARVPGILRRISIVSDDVWPVLERRAKARAIAEAMRHTDDAAALAACREVLRLLRDGGTEEEFDAAEAASWAAGAAADAAGWASTCHPTAAACAANSAACAADPDADAAAWDRMTAALLDDLDDATQGRDLGPFPMEISR